MQSFQTLDDAWGNPTPVPLVSTTRHVLKLEPGIARDLTVPAGAGRVLINATADLWVQYNAAATLPAADMVTGTAPELNPAGRALAGITSLGLVSADGCLASLCFYA